MHHALHIEEVLLNIFGHCHPVDPTWTIERRHCTTDLAALARTCHTFKEPALDVLWSELIDLSPLAFCLPECRRSSSMYYSFTRPRNDAEWDTLKSYTHRVWRIVSFSSPNGNLDATSISAFFRPPFTVSLFPNLRFLRWQGGTIALPVIHFAVPLLTSLDIRGASQEDVSVYTNLLDALVPQCPNIRKVRIQVAHGIGFGEAVYRHLCTWNRLQVVDCLDVAMPADVMRHLSSVSTLLWLSFTLDVQSSHLIPPPNASLVFSQLVYLEIVSASLESVTSLMTHVRLPVIQVLIVPFSVRPSEAIVRSYLSTVHEGCSFESLTDFRLLHFRSFPAHISSVTDPTSDNDRLDLDDMRPCMAFHNLRAIHINLEWSLDLTDSDLLELVSAWPTIEHLVLNDRWGWRTTRGITLDGLQRILQRCKLLWELCIAVDTESASETSQPLDVDLSLRKQFRLNVADSPIRRESVSALGTVFSVFGFSYGSDRFLAWNGSEMRDIPGGNNFRCLWKSVFL